eukprot:scaffold1297_cov368-Prasinococcus_capsulatus_cf.AAC.12
MSCEGPNGCRTVNRLDSVLSMAINSNAVICSSSSGSGSARHPNSGPGRPPTQALVTRSELYDTWAGLCSRYLPLHLLWRAHRQPRMAPIGCPGLRCRPWISVQGPDGVSSPQYTAMTDGLKLDAPTECSP